MDYIAEHLDVNKLEDALMDHRDIQQQQMLLAQEKARSFFEGYERAIYDIKGMFHCCNYENRDRKTESFIRGAHDAIHKICRSLGINDQKICNMDVCTDEKAALIAEEIKKTFLERQDQSEEGLS